MEKKIGAINERREKLTQEYSQLQRVLEHTESELAKVMGVCTFVEYGTSVLLYFCVSFVCFRPNPLSPRLYNRNATV